VKKISSDHVHLPKFWVVENYLVFPITFAMFVDISSLDKLTARTTTVSHLAVGEALLVDAQLGGESSSSKENA
jgi:hypothetical protein